MTLERIVDLALTYVMWCIVAVLIIVIGVGMVLLFKAIFAVLILALILMVIAELT